MKKNKDYYNVEELKLNRLTNKKKNKSQKRKFIKNVLKNR